MTEKGNKSPKAKAPETKQQQDKPDIEVRAEFSLTKSTSTFVRVTTSRISVLNRLLSSSSSRSTNGMDPRSSTPSMTQWNWHSCSDPTVQSVSAWSMVVFWSVLWPSSLPWWLSAGTSNTRSPSPSPFSSSAWAPTSSWWAFSRCTRHS